MSDTLEVGSTLGNYELLVPLGRGGMASVWVARQRSRTSPKQRLVAVKAMLPELAQSPDFRSMFLGEGQIVRSIEHENVVRVYEVGEDRGILHMAMEWVEGDSLRALIKGAKQWRAIPSDIAVRIIADAAAGLHAAHELRGWDGELRQIVHCDVSPHNILIGTDGVAKIVDFGVANAVVHARMDRGDTIQGKFGYMSPEQACAKPLDRRADIFALGVVLFELTTGERLFRGRDHAHTLQLVLHGQIPRPSALDPGYSPGLESIVMRALERDVRARYQTADELRSALEHHLIEERVMVTRAGVAQIVKRVLAEAVEARRQTIRQARRSIDGRESAPDIAPCSAPPSSLTLSETQPSALVDAARIAPPPPGRARPRTAGFVIAALCGLGSVAASLVWAFGGSFRSAAPEPTPEGSAAAAPSGSSAASSLPAASGDSVDLGSLPVIPGGPLPTVARSVVAAPAAASTAPPPASAVSAAPTAPAPDEDNHVAPRPPHPPPGSTRPPVAQPAAPGDVPTEPDFGIPPPPPMGPDYYGRSGGGR